MITYRLGSFNVNKLSYATRNPELGSDAQARKDYATIGSIIRDNFHIVALQEVSNDRVLSRLFPPYCEWEYAWEKTHNKYGNSDEGYAFAWDTRYFSTVTKPVIWNQYRQDIVLGHLGLFRHPYYGRFIPVGLSGKPFCEIRIINTHIRFDPKFIPEAFSGNTVALRNREFKVLSENILNYLASKQYKDESRPAYTLLMGDYNLNLQTPINSGPYVPREFVLVENSGRRKKFITVQDKKTTLGKTSSSNGTDTVWRFASNYDHFTYIEDYMDARGAHVETDVIDTVRQYRNGDFEKHWREISDHIPILLELDFRSGARMG